MCVCVCDRQKRKWEVKEPPETMGYEVIPHQCVQFAEYLTGRKVS